MIVSTLSNRMCACALTQTHADTYCGVPTSVFVLLSASPSLREMPKSASLITLGAIASHVRITY
jgi:hypothetical protein